ncbi:MAG: hypothetical protein JOY67_00445 [Hyphomicrobiales bacterium]|nr:hypothetical protein [Hyphomicrobiales bacterium]MBV9518088.1 hypothetical protein [Hyphomicrobiales bacterium]
MTSLAVFAKPFALAKPFAFAKPFARERRRPRFCTVAAIALALSSLCACEAGTDLLGAGVTSASGWTRLPTREWLLNEGLGPANIAYCEVPSCPRPTVVATFAAEGEEAKRLSRALADPKALLKAERFKVATARDPRLKSKPALDKPKSREKAERIEADGFTGYRVTLTPEVADGHEAYAVVLSAREGEKLQAALAVTTDPDAALQAAEAAARSFGHGSNEAPPRQRPVEEIAK